MPQDAQPGRVGNREPASLGVVWSGRAFLSAANREKAQVEAIESGRGCQQECTAVAVRGQSRLARTCWVFRVLVQRSPADAARVAFSGAARGAEASLAAHQRDGLEWRSAFTSLAYLRG